MSQVDPLRNYSDKIAARKDAAEAVQRVVDRMLHVAAAAREWQILVISGGGPHPCQDPAEAHSISREDWPSIDELDTALTRYRAAEHEVDTAIARLGTHDRQMLGLESETN